MAKAVGQELTGIDHDWHAQYSHEGRTDSAMDFVTGPLEETMTVVKEKVWSFSAALKSVAEVLVGFGMSPSIIGYSSVPLSEVDECPAQKDEGEAALKKVIEAESISRNKQSLLSVYSSEERNLIHHEEEVEDNDHAFVNAGQKETEERKFLKGQGQDTLTEDAYEYKDK